MDSRKKYIALYSRTSTSYQATGLEAQKRALKEYCRQNNIKSYRLFFDEGISGSKSSRPQLDVMMSEVRSGNVDAVVVYSFSRFARSTQHLLSALQEFDQHEVSFVSLSEQLDTSTAIGRALFTIISAIAELERELISERVKCGLENAKAKGKKLGREKSRNSKLIRELANKRLSQRKIAELVGCCKSTVQRELKQMVHEGGL
ncbi:resolvase [Candidatus Kaiserbacteria bacterium]|nr:MAG: resolvase [Candidatus Kaiserbacteria bacterium]